MSRIGKQAITLPGKVTVKLDGQKISVDSLEKGRLKVSFPLEEKRFFEFKFRYFKSQLS